MTRRSGAWVRSRSGNAATEFAFILPIMLLFIAGIVEFGRIIQVYSAVNRLATRYAVVYSDCYDYPTGTCNTELTTYTSSMATKNVAPQLNNTLVSLRMFEVSMSSATPATATIKYPTGSNATLSAAELVQAQTVIGAGQTGVVVTVSYQHSLLFFAQIMSQFIASNKLAVSYTVAQRKT